MQNCAFLVFFLSYNVGPVLNVGVDMFDYKDFKPPQARGRRATGRQSITYCYQDASCKQGAPNSPWEQGVCKSGQSQSPISLDPDLTLTADQSKQDCTTLDLTDAHTKYHFQNYDVENKGNTIEIQPKAADLPNFKWNLRGHRTYKLAQIHFHWGPTSDFGSEHALGGRSYAMEMHMVHHDEKFSTLGDAVSSNEEFALAVIGLFLETDAEAADSFLKPIVDTIPQILAPKTTKEVAAAFDLTKVFEMQTEAYTYSGSLTTPPCSEVVAWLVLRKPVLIKEADVAAFRTITHAANQPTTLNYRKLNPLNARDVDVIRIKA